MKQRTNDEEQHESTLDKLQESNSSFTNRQSFYQSLSKAEKNLPRSPRKKLEVVSNLAKKYELRVQYDVKRGRKTKLFTEDQKDWVGVFGEV